MHEQLGWIVWNFEYKPPKFENKDLALSVRFPQFANVYHVSSTKKGNQNFPQMWLSTLWEMWYSLFSRTKDHQWIWCHNDKNTTLEGVSCAFWLRRVINKFSTHARYFYSVDRWRYGCSNIRGEPYKGKQFRNISCQFICINYLIRSCVYVFI